MILSTRNGFQHLHTSLLAICVAVVLLADSRTAAAQRGGGNTADQGNVGVWYDVPSNTLFAIGDVQGNRFIVSIVDGQATVSAGISATRINGEANGIFSTSIEPQRFSIVIKGMSGNDQVQLQVGTELTAPDIDLDGGDGDDTLNVHVNVPPESWGAILGNLTVYGGKGADKVNLAMLFNEKALGVAGDLSVVAGDGVDEVTIYDRVIVDGVSLMHGGSGRDVITLSRELLTTSVVTDFSSIKLW